MKDNIPKEINERLTYFQDEVKKQFAFLTEFAYSLDEIDMGREDFLEYYSKLIFKNGNTSININYETDIIKGHTLRFPEVKERPVIDNLISCFITDPNAFLSVSSFAESKQLLPSTKYFNIELNAININDEILRVVRNYSTFFQDNLVAVLKKEKIYNAYTDRFYDKIFKEIHYR